MSRLILFIFFSFTVYSSNAMQSPCITESDELIVVAVTSSTTSLILDGVE